MDDVEDNSELRRGIPVAHTIYGVPQTINTANYVYFLAMQELLKLGADDHQKGKGKGKERKVDVVAVVTGELCDDQGWSTSADGFRGAVESASRSRIRSVLEGQLDMPYGGGVCAHGPRQ